MHAIEHILTNADLFIAIGTSGSVYPAAGFVQVCNAVGAYSIEMNIVPSETQNAFSEHRYGLATDLATELVDELISII